MMADDEPRGWRQIAVTTARVAMAEAVFERFDAAAISELDAGDVPTVELTPHDPPRFTQSKVVGLFALDANVEPIKRELAQTLGRDTRVEIDELSARDWSTAWLAHHPPLHFGGRLWVAPHDATVATQADDDVILRLDPGLAFGTGTHPTTALCLAWLAHTHLRGCTVLDYGCGSGILAIAAALLGAKQVWAVDIDDQAMRATRDNAAANGVAERISTPPIDALGSQGHDIVLANILARPLIELAPTLTALTRSGGQLVLSGLLQRQVDSVRTAYEKAFAFAAPAHEQDWIRLDGVHKASCST